METISLRDPQIVQKVVEVLSKGGLVIYPTETAYGVGVDATNPDAVTKLLTYKKRPQGKAISVGCANEHMADIYVERNAEAEHIYNTFLPGPVTVISKTRDKHTIDPRLIAENGTLGIRIPDHKTVLEIITTFGKPITTTSANSAGKKTPYSVQDVLDTLSQKQKDMIDLVIDGGELPKNLTSTVIDTTANMQVYRRGGVDFSGVKSNGKKYITKSAQETIELGKKLLQEHVETLSHQSIFFQLRGDLGVGKTHFTKGIAQALGITRTIKSPTYTYMQEYSFTQPQQGTLYHVDAWRLISTHDVEQFPISDWLLAGNVLVVEWPDILLNEFGEEIFDSSKTIKVTGEQGESQDERVFWIEGG